MKKNVSSKIVLAVLLLAAVFSARAESQEDELKWAGYCKQTGGGVVTLVAKYDTSSGIVYGLSKEFCQYVKDGHSTILGLDTLASDKPSLAATYSQSVVIKPDESLPMKPFGNPGMDVCLKLKGVSIAYTVAEGGSFVDDKDGEAGICVFADGSSIEGWSLIDIAGSQDMKKLIRSEPLGITIPDIYRDE